MRDPGTVGKTVCVLSACKNDFRRSFWRLWKEEIRAHSFTSKLWTQRSTFRIQSCLPVLHTLSHTQRLTPKAVFAPVTQFLILPSCSIHFILAFAHISPENLLWSRSWTYIHSMNGDAYVWLHLHSQRLLPYLTTLSFYLFCSIPLDLLHKSHYFIIIGKQQRIKRKLYRVTTQVCQFLTFFYYLL